MFCFSAVQVLSIGDNFSRLSANKPMGFKRLKHLAFKISKNKSLWMDIYINGHSFSLGQVMFQKHTPRAVDI